jgi:hypothetical protein
MTCTTVSTVSWGLTVGSSSSMISRTVGMAAQPTGRARR